MITDELLFRFLNQETSKKENQAINAWLSGDPDHESRLKSLKESYESIDLNSDPDDMQNRWNIIATRLNVTPSVLTRRNTLPLRLARVAAVLLLLICSGVLLFHQMNTHIIRNKELTAKTVLLPDGSHVDLGPGSKLVYSSKFMNGSREIKLTGEAYFDVTVDPEHPFIVVAGYAKIKVTGTKFVVNASPRNEEIEVSVKSGNVLFYNSDTLNKNSFRMGLVAGEKGIFYPALNRMDKTCDPRFFSAP
ncbi:MAG: FecR family protein [Bacteroidales bacterium]|nr:FecR family protein [Bacteroidales bacterium]